MTMSSAFSVNLLHVSCPPQSHYLYQQHSRVRFHRTPICSANPENKSGGFISREDASYVGKLSVGSIAGGAVIKYGSILFPSITIPNFTQAVFMIGIPVIASIFLLLQASTKQKL